MHIIMVSSVCSIAIKMAKMVPIIEYNRFLQRNEVCETRYKLLEWLAFLQVVLVLISSNKTYRLKQGILTQSTELCMLNF